MSTEDPATGSAAGPLSAYLYQHEHLVLVDGSARIEVHQGHVVGRECVIHVVLTKDASQGLEVLNVNLISGGCLVSSGRLVAPDASTEF
ncbi:hypothetical protein PT974_10968 [Cladobotryum mycophilum]|uniref:Uncharacterized protein n=1 Tax=Cladobotryum mycophilum TaxID=491253 RepID=A0ABR0SBV8_9HYPO